MNKILLLASAAAVVVDAERHRFRVGPTGIVSFAEGRAKMRAKMAAKTGNTSAMQTYTTNAATGMTSTAAIDNNEVGQLVQPEQIQSAQLPASIRDNPTLYALVDADQDGTCTAYVAEVYTSGKCSPGNTEATDEFFDTKTYPDCESYLKSSNLCTTSTCQDLICNYGWFDYYPPPYQHYSTYCNCGTGISTWIIVAICAGVAFFIIVGVVVCLMMRDPAGKAGTGEPDPATTTYYTEETGEGYYEEGELYEGATTEYVTNPDGTATYAAQY